MIFYEMCQALCLTPRWAGLQTTRIESVMEHKALVLMYTHEIACNGDKYAEVMRTAIAHDCEEAVVGDIKYVVKKECGSVLDEILENYSKEKLPPFYAKYAFDENRIVYCADVLAAAHFALNEVNMGNPYFITISGDVYGRCEDAVKNLQGFPFEFANASKILKLFIKLKI